MELQPLEFALMGIGFLLSAVGIISLARAQSVLIEKHGELRNEFDKLKKSYDWHMIGHVVEEEEEE